MVPYAFRFDVLTYAHELITRERRNTHRSVVGTSTAELLMTMMTTVNQLTRGTYWQITDAGTGQLRTRTAGTLAHDNSANQYSYLIAVKSRVVHKATTGSR